MKTFKYFGLLYIKLTQMIEYVKCIDSHKTTGVDPEVLKREGLLFVGRHGWPAKKILGFRWSKKTK